MDCPKCGHPLSLTVLDSQKPDFDTSHCPACDWNPDNEESCNNCANNGSGECDDCREDGNSNWERTKQETFLTKQINCKHFTINYQREVGYFFMCRKFTCTDYKQCPCAAIEEMNEEERKARKVIKWEEIGHSIKR